MPKPQSSQNILHRYTLRLAVGLAGANIDQSKQRARWLLIACSITVQCIHCSGQQSPRMIGEASPNRDLIGQCILAAVSGLVRLSLCALQPC